MFIKQEKLEKPAAEPVQITVELLDNREIKRYQFKVADNVLFGSLRNRERHRYSEKTVFERDFEKLRPNLVWPPKLVRVD